MSGSKQFFCDIKLHSHMTWALIPRLTERKCTHVCLCTQFLSLSQDGTRYWMSPLTYFWMCYYRLQTAVTHIQQTPHDNRPLWISDHLKPAQKNVIFTNEDFSVTNKRSIVQTALLVSYIERLDRYVKLTNYFIIQCNLTSWHMIANRAGQKTIDFSILIDFHETILILKFQESISLACFQLMKETL